MAKSWQPFIAKIERIKDGVRSIVDFALAFENGGSFIATTDRVHREAHEGELFSAGVRFPENVGDDAESILLITNPTSNKEFHITFLAASNALAFVDVFWNPTLDSNIGTPLTPRNHKRNKASNPDDSGAVVVYNPAFSDNGTNIFPGIIPGSSGGISSGGTGVVNREEDIIGPGESIALVHTNKGGNSKTVSLSATWYEETEGSI
jgi:hypothetical protein